MSVHVWKLGVAAGVAALGCGDDTTVPPQACESDCSEPENDDDCSEDECLPAPNEHDDTGGECGQPSASTLCCERDLDCDAGKLCGGVEDGVGECAAVQTLPVCEGLGLAQIATGIPGEGIMSLVFADLDADLEDELLIDRGAEHSIVDGPELLEAPLQLEDAGDLKTLIVDDFDGDGAREFLKLAGPSRIRRWVPNAVGSFVQTELANPAGVLLSDGQTMDWNDDGARDVVAIDIDGAAVVLLGDGSGGFVDVVDLVDPLSDLVVGRFTSVARDDLAVQAGEATRVVVGGSAQLVPVLPDASHGTRRLVAADFDANGSWSLVGYTPWQSSTLLEIWAAGASPRWFHSIPFEVDDARVASVNGDSVPDLLFTGERAVVVLGAELAGLEPSGVACAAELDHGGAAAAFGDFDGDARVDVATIDGGELVIWRGIDCGDSC